MRMATNIMDIYVNLGRRRRLDTKNWEGSCTNIYSLSWHERNWVGTLHWSLSCTYRGCQKISLKIFSRHTWDSKTSHSEITLKADSWLPKHVKAKLFSNSVRQVDNKWSDADMKALASDKLYWKKWVFLLNLNKLNGYFY